MYDVIIVGAGPAGLTSAIYSTRAGYNTLVLEEGTPGGQASTTDIIENYPGFPQGISGPELMMKFYEQAEKFGCTFKFESVKELDLTGKIKKVITSTEIYDSRAVIIASGARPRILGVEGEEKYRGKGVSYCGTCDGFFFKGKEVLVVGGGDTAAEEALYLAKMCKKVTLIHRRDKLRATKILQDKVLSHEKIELIWDSVVDNIFGEKMVEGVTIHNIKTQEKIDLKVEGLFIFVGYIPNSDYLPKELHLDEKGYIISNDTLETNLPGVFVVGDVRQKTLKQVATAVGDGALALVALEEYLEKKEDNSHG